MEPPFTSIWPLPVSPAQISFDAVIEPLPERGAQALDDSQERWDRSNVHVFTGTYGDYLLAKVGKVFPDLGQKVL